VGNVEWIVTGPGDGMQQMMGGEGFGGGGESCTGSEEQYTAVRFVYGPNGRTVNYISNEKWCWYDGYQCPDQDCDE
jgi:hypothetical protein